MYLDYFQILFDYCKKCKWSQSYYGKNYSSIIILKVGLGSKEALDSSVTSSGDSSGEKSASNSISKHRREVLIRQPSYCKILDDLQGTEERVLKGIQGMKGQQNVLEVHCDSSPIHILCFYPLAYPLFLQFFSF